jgi:AcrR family transcriptional regulator
MRPIPEAARPPDSAREALLDAATGIFARDGFDGARVEAIARAAGVNKAMINYHFGGKAGLYTAILLHTFEGARERFAGIRTSREPADARLRAFIRAFADMASRRPQLPAMLLREVMSGGRHLDDRVLPQLLSLFALVRETVQRGIREGTFRRADPFATHLSLVGGLVFFFATQPFRKRLVAEGKVPFPAPSPAAFVRHMEELFARGLAPDGARRPRRRSRP